MENSTVIEAVSLRCITEVSHQWVVFPESVVSLLSSHLQHDDHESAHQETRVSKLVILVGAVVVDLEVSVLVIL